MTRPRSAAAARDPAPGPPGTTSQATIQCRSSPALQTRRAAVYALDQVPAMSDSTNLRKKVREFPTTPGVYLMKDARGRVIYIGKAVNLRSRAGSYFRKAAELDPRTADMVRAVRDVDFIAADSEVDALL